mmetsp:Transcript_9455/g.16242  ORF Transcript_9455/g.16242 Transcript_9455/m.16242 type:complete len:237 (-) Transcript_9455:799-1509(-)
MQGVLHDERLEQRLPLALVLPHGQNEHQHARADEADDYDHRHPPRGDTATSAATSVLSCLNHHLLEIILVDAIRGAVVVLNGRQRLVLPIATTHEPHHVVVDSLQPVRRALENEIARVDICAVCLLKEQCRETIILHHRRECLPDGLLHGASRPRRVDHDGVRGNSRPLACVPHVHRLAPSLRAEQLVVGCQVTSSPFVITHRGVLDESDISSSIGHALERSIVASIRICSFVAKV